MTLPLFLLLYKDITWKVNLRCLRLYRACSILFNSSNVGKFFWSWIPKDSIKVQEKKNKAVVLWSCLWQNVKLHVIVVQRRLRNVQKRLMHVQSCCFANLNPLLFSCFHCLSSLMLTKKLLTNLKLSQQCQHCIYNHNKQRAPEVWTVSKHISLESQWWNWKHNTTHLVVDILQVNVKFFTGKTK